MGLVLLRSIVLTHWTTLSSFKVLVLPSFPNDSGFLGTTDKLLVQLGGKRKAEGLWYKWESFEPKEGLE
jgi:hypothetical protein